LRGVIKIITTNDTVMTLDRIAFMSLRLNLPLIVIVSPFANADKVDDFLVINLRTV